MVTISPARVKAARKALGWSQQELADRAGIQLETLAHFEAGRKSRAKTVEAIASALEREGKLGDTEAGKGAYAGGPSLHLPVKF